MSSLTGAITGPPRQVLLALATVASTVALAGTPTAVPASQAMDGASGHAACTSRTSGAGTLSVCPGKAPVGSRLTLYAHGCIGASLVFLGPLDYIGSGGGGETLPGVVTDRNGPSPGKPFVVPPKYLAGGDLDALVAVSAEGQYQFGSYPANECSVPFTVTAPPGTRTLIYNPFDAAGLKPGVNVIARASGTCVQDPSPVELRSYYRCFTTVSKKTPGGASVFDPCFARPPRAGHLAVEMICPTGPANGDVIALAVKAITSSPGFRGVGTPRSATARALAPWAVQLADGQICQLVEAAWGDLGPYSCQGQPAGGRQPGGPAPGTPVADCRIPQASQPRWTALCQLKEAPASPFHKTAIATAWF